MAPPCPPPAKAQAGTRLWDALDSPAVMPNLGATMAGVGKLLKQAQKMQKGIAEAQQRLADERIEVSHGGGAVKVVVDGHGRIQALTLYPDFLKEGAAVVEPALVTALQEATDRARALHEATMSKATAGFQLPGL
jgi:DNA-binding protein YbaB